VPHQILKPGYGPVLGYTGGDIQIAWRLVAFSTLTSSLCKEFCKCESQPARRHQHGQNVEIFLKNSWNCEVRQNLFTKICFTNTWLSYDSQCV